ncbi:uncharacterized protein CTRU02_214002 [Colletotrichum truncatum]|uniref:Uncharacterized protein n=1 Tax=Colletotrichum truncatum TaxID=5467 RepID=A0ACC3YHA7_COLTU|nr:uncharacterized protein CTRU02_06316 [Colletotrichum truncatum]KAF6792820.1 hypothetical protein CTRU02_06316 [Colletotrichum truncatum]
MVSLSFLVPNFKAASRSITLAILLGLVDSAIAAVQCDTINWDTCGEAAHRHKLPTSVGSTYYVDGFHGGVMHAKFQSMTQSVSGNSEYHDITYNFNLGDYDGTYWVILPSPFGDANTCYAVYKNCDVTIKFWNLPVPTWYQLA